MHLSIIFLILAVAISGSYSNHVRTKRMYGLCPPNFYRIGSLCYFISREKLNWLDAHFECKDKNSKLAEPGKITDRQLRKYLMTADESRDEIWIGGSYEWNQNKWRWGYSGNDIKYQSFSQLDPRQNLQYHCAAINPEIKYRWSARPCVDAHRFICQHKMPKVSARNRERVYTRWNETYPNQMANEVLLEVVDDGRLPRNQRRRKPNAQNTTTLDTNQLPVSSQPLSDQSSPSIITTEPTLTVDKPGNKRSQWSPVRINGPRPNGLNNETIEKPRRKTDFDKIAERKRQKEIRRRKRIQERRKQKEAERRRKEEEVAARKRAYESQNFPQPVTEILMIPEIISDQVVTTTTQRINLNVEDRKEFFPFVEKEDEKEVEQSTSTTTTTTSSPNENKQPEKAKDPPTVAPVLAINTPPEKYDEYLVKLDERDKEELQRIAEEQRKRETLKRQREEEMDRLKKLAEEQRLEEQRLAEEIKKHQEEDRKIKEEEERVRQEKAQKEAEEKKRNLEKQAARMEVLRKYKEKLRRQKEEKLHAALASQSSENTSTNNENETEASAAPPAKPTDITEEDKKLRLQMLRERLQKLTPEQRKRFHELRMQRKREKQKRSHLINKRSVKKSIP